MNRESSRSALAVIARSEATKQSSCAPAGAPTKKQLRAANVAHAFLARLPARGWLLRCARNDGEGASRAFSIQLSNSDETQTRIIAPCSLRPQGKPSHSCSLSPRRERAERLAKNRFRGRSLARRASRTPFEKLTADGQWLSPTGETVGLRPKASDAVSHLRSAHGWICRPAGCPRVCCLCQRAPFVRTAARTCTRAVRCLCRRLPRPPPWIIDPQRRPRPDNIADLRVPFHAAKTIAARSLSVRDADKIFLLG